MTTADPAKVPTVIASATQPSGESMSCWATANAVTATNQYTTGKGSSFATLARMNEGVARGPPVDRGHNERAVATAGNRTLRR